MKPSKLFIFVFLLFFYPIISAPIFAMNWEMGLRITDGYGNPIRRSITLYYVTFTGYNNKYLTKLQTSYSQGGHGFTPPQM